MSWNIDQVVQNINTLYSSNDPEIIENTQQQLQVIQKSGDGYKLAQSLLNHPSRSCKYFGALTFTVFINTHLTGVATDETKLLSERISDEQIEWVIQLVFRASNDQELEGNMFIVKKLLSNLSILYISSGSKLMSPVSQLLFKYKLESSDPDDSFHSLSEIQLMVLLNLNTILVEDIGKSHHSRSANGSSKDIFGLIYTEVFPYFNDLLNYLLTATLSPNLRSVTLDAVNAWVIYISNAEAHSTQRYGESETQSLMELLLRSFDTNALKVDSDDLTRNMEILNKAFTTLTEVVELNIRMLNPFKSAVNSILFDQDKFGLAFVHSVIFDNAKFDEFNPEIENYVNLLICYLSFNLVQISRNLLDDSVFRIVNIALDLTNYPANPIYDERLSELFLPFWEEFVNAYIDEESLQDLPEEFKARRDEVMNRLSVIYWKKAYILDPEHSNEFIHYRQQIAELFIVLHSLLGNVFYSSLCSGITDKLIQYNENPSSEVIVTLEASLYLLFKITDDLSFYDELSNEHLIPLIESIFSHKLIELAEVLTASGVVHQIHVTLLNFLSCIQFFYKSKAGLLYLTSTFNFLFSVVLGKLGSQKNIPLIASKTVLKICQDSKDNLTVFLPNLQLILYEILGNSTIDNLIRERMVNAYVSIANSLQDPFEFGKIVHGLLQKIDDISLNLINDEMPVFANTKTNEELSELKVDMSISLLTCINEMGKASSIPEDLEEYLSVTQIAQTNAYWEKDPLNVKQLILKKLFEFSISSESLSQNTLVTEQCCNILRHGLNEPIDGPFKFEMDAVVGFLISKVQYCNQQSIPYIYSLVESLVKSNSKILTTEWMNGLLEKIFVELEPVLVTEMDLIKSCIELFTTILEKRPSLLLNLKVFETDIIKLALDSLNFNETFMIKLITKFWVTLITLKRGSQEDHERIKYYLINLQISGSDRNLCLHLTNNLLFAFLNTARSNLDQYYPLFRNLIGKFPLQFKEATRDSLFLLYEEQGERSKVNEAQLNVFLQQLVLSRGQRSVNDVLKKFWLQYNGLVDFK